MEESDNKDTFEWDLAHRVATESLIVIVIGFILAWFPDPIGVIGTLMCSLGFFVLADACGAVQGQKPWIFRNLPWKDRN